MSTDKVITIAGGGFSGTSVLAMQVAAIRRACASGIEVPKTQINIVNPKLNIGPGFPYDHKRDIYLLNQPAYAMSPFPYEPNHFVDWLVQKNSNVLRQNLENSFQPRSVYGECLKDIFQETVNGSGDLPVTVKVIESMVSDAVFGQANIEVSLESGSLLYSDKLIVADGHHKNELLAELRAQPNYWDGSVPEEGFVGAPTKHNKVLIVGSGQDMMDRLSDLDYLGYGGEIHVASRRGVLPWVFDPELYHPNRDVEPYQLKHFTIKNIQQSLTFEDCKSLWRAEINNAQNSGYGIGHVLGAYFSDSALKEFSDNLAETKEWKKTQSHIQAVYGNPTPQQRFDLLQRYQNSKQLSSKFSQVTTKSIKIQNDQTFQVTFDDGDVEAYDAIFNAASCARSLKDPEGHIRSSLIASLDQQGVMKWSETHSGILVSGAQADARVFYAGPYSHPNRWGCETFRDDNEQVAKMSLNL